MADTQAQPGFELKLADGSVVKTDNIDDAVKVLAKMKEDTAAALKSEREQREQLQAQMNDLQAQVAAAQRPPARTTDNNGFNRDHYYKLIGEDPVMAQNYIDAHRFGLGDPAQVPQYFQGIHTTVTNLEQQTLAAQFINTHSDFPANNDNAQILTREVMRLRELGHPVDMSTLDTAWHNVVSAELIKPLEAAEEPETPNPTLGGSGAAAAEAESARIEDELNSGKMSMQDFEKFLRSKGMFGGG